jgi:hypothetical protein
VNRNKKSVAKEDARLWPHNQSSPTDAAKNRKKIYDPILYCNSQTELFCSRMNDRAHYYKQNT